MLVSRSFKLVLISGTALAPISGAMAAPAFAQSTQDTTPPAPTPTTAATPEIGADVTSSQTDSRGEEVIVTGSRIKRDPNQSALPLTIITTRELERNSISNPEQLIAYLPTNGTGSDNLASNADVVSGQGRGANGASFANLRGQGSGATLILLNSRRIAAHGLQGSAVDVNQIPFAAIDRVEVLKEGASAIYGTDAVGGVINFILRKDYRGFGIQGFSDFTTRGDHDVYRTSAIAGHGDLAANGFNVMAAVSYSKVPELRASDRNFVDTFQPERGLSVDTRGTPFATIIGRVGTAFPNNASFPLIPGTTTSTRGGINVLDLPGGEGCEAGGPDMAPYDTALWEFPQAEYACAWDSGRAASMQQPLSTLTWLGRGVVAFGDHEVTAELTGSDAEATKRFSHVQLTPNSTSRRYAHPSTGANYDAVFDRLVAAFPQLEARRGQSLSYRWRCLECGRREITTDTSTARYSLGLDGPLVSGWDYRTGVSYATSQSKSELGSGYYFVTPLVAALNTGIINPFLFPGQTQSQAALDLLEGASAEGVVLYGGKYSVSQVDASVSGPLFQLPGGTVRAAIGADLRREKYAFNGDERAATERPDILAAPFDDENALDGAKRNIKAAYAELLVPVLANLELTLAGRIDQYSGYGTTKNPLIAFKYRPFRPLMLRGNYNTAFRVPAFNQLFNGRQAALYTGLDVADPGKCPGGVPNSTDPNCAALDRSFDLVTGGNPDLEPETAKMASLGFVFQPTRDFSASVDWWKINRKGTMQLLSLRDLVNNYAFFQDRFIRDSAGNLIEVDQSWINTGAWRTQGLEIALRGAGQVLGGRLSGGIDGTYLLKRKEMLIEGAEFENRVGVFSYAGDLGLRWKHNAFVSFGRGAWTLALTQLFRSGYENQELPGVASGTVNPPDLEKRVNNYILYNVSASLDVSERMRLTLGVKNLFDKDPPFAISYDTNTGGGSSWEPRVADPRGRSLTVNADVKF